MKKLIEITTLAALCAIVAGCKSVTVTRHPATLAKIATADGGEKVATDSKGAPIVLDGGWEVEYFQHGNWQKFDAMSATAGAGVTFALNGYEGGTDYSNLAKLVEGADREDRRGNRHQRRLNRGGGRRKGARGSDLEVYQERRRHVEGDRHLRGRQLHNQRRNHQRGLRGLLRGLQSEVKDFLDDEIRRPALDCASDS